MDWKSLLLSCCCSSFEKTCQNWKGWAWKGWAWKGCGKRKRKRRNSRERRRRRRRRRRKAWRGSTGCAAWKGWKAKNRKSNHGCHLVALVKFMWLMGSVFFKFCGKVKSCNLEKNPVGNSEKGKKVLPLNGGEKILEEIAGKEKRCFP